MNAHDHEATVRAILRNASPSHCKQCGGSLEAEEREAGATRCGLCFEVTEPMRNYLAAFDRWLADGFGLAERARTLRTLRGERVAYVD